MEFKEYPIAPLGLGASKVLEDSRDSMKTIVITDKDFKLVPVKSWDEGLKKTEKKEIDMLSCIAKTKERVKKLNFTEPYVSYPFVLITTKDKPFLADLNALSCAKPHGPAPIIAIFVFIDFLIN